jgi:hypothetical protein
MVEYTNQFGDAAAIDCTQLEKYLKSSLWRMADHETRKLLYMACGQNPADQQYSIQPGQIPCVDLQVIDQLWNKYSQGRFGFTAQRPIWLTCEKKFYSKTEAWNQFGSKVGWRVNHLLKQNYWKKHNELTFTLDAPVGHLPHMGEKFGILTMEAFIKHLDYCNAPPVE